MAKIYNDISGEQEQTSQSMKGYDHTRFSNDRRYMQLVLLAAHYYDNMIDLRKKWKRDIDYSMGRQLLCITDKPSEFTTIWSCAVCRH